MIGNCGLDRSEDSCGGHLRAASTCSTKETGIELSLVEEVDGPSTTEEVVCQTDSLEGESLDKTRNLISGGNCWCSDIFSQQVV